MSNGPGTFILFRLAVSVVIDWRLILSVVLLLIVLLTK